MDCGKPVEKEIYFYDIKQELEKYIVKGSLSLGISLNEDQVKKLIIFQRIIHYYQKKTNLTSITNVHDVIDKHFLDSLSCIKLIKEAYNKIDNKTKIIDVGSGAGLPGIPVKIFFAGVEMLLLEAKKKKKDFLVKAVEFLKLSNVSVVQNRSENIGKNLIYREKYQIVLSRAVASLGVLCEYCLPLCKKEGIMVAFKGSKFKQELSENYKVIEELGGFLESVNIVKIPNSRHIRSIILIRKIKPTPEKYPRRNGIPLKRPLSF